MDLWQAAAANNAQWCDLIARSHGLSTCADRQAWTCQSRPPPLHPDAVTLVRCLSVPDLLSLWVPKTSSTPRDQVIFADQATDASLPSDAVLLKIDRFGQRFQRRRGVQGAVRPVLIVVGLVLAQDPPQMGLVPDEGAGRSFLLRYAAARFS